MDTETLKNYEKAGRIAAEALLHGKKRIKKGESLLEVTEQVEQFVLKQAKLAFPFQISSNHIAAHYYPDHDDKTIFTNQLLKLDVGVQVSGCIGDTACTVDLSGEYADLVKASEEALKNAISVIKNGITLGEIGRVIQESITPYGYAPVRNLCGHGLDLYDIHSSPSIPNTDTGDKTSLIKGQVVAIEPFASTGAGMIIETSNATLYQVLRERAVRDPTTRDILNFVKQYEGLVFAKRWLVREYPLFKVNLALKNLLNLGIIREYPPLADKAKGMVSQAEHTIIVEEDKARILTNTDSD